MKQQRPYHVVVSVMAHHSRQEQTLGLLTRRDAGVVGVAVEDGHGEIDTGIRAWKTLRRFEDTSAVGWAIVIQDDALPIEGFQQHAETVLRALDRDAVVSFYVGTGQPRPHQVQIAVDQADDNESAWLECDALLWGVAVAVPVARVESLVAYLEASSGRYDTLIGRWAQGVELPILYTWPSLVDHADGPSLAHPEERKAERRRAHRVGVPSGAQGRVTRIAARF